MFSHSAWGVCHANSSFRYDGQAGAAGITLEDPATEAEFMANLHRELKKKGVPSYAIPRLVRLIEK
jgi:chorismate mutase